MQRQVKTRTNDQQSCSKPSNASENGAEDKKIKFHVAFLLGSKHPQDGKDCYDLKGEGLQVLRCLIRFESCHMVRVDSDSRHNKWNRKRNRWSNLSSQIKKVSE